MCVCANALLGDAQVNLLSEGHLCNRGIPGTVLTLTTSQLPPGVKYFTPWGVSIMPPQKYRVQSLLCAERLCARNQQFGLVILSKSYRLRA